MSNRTYVPCVPWATAAAILFLLTPRVWAAAPQVVSTTPTRDQKDVDPGLKEIRVKFDQPMDHGGQSIVGGGPTFPKIIDKTRWIDAQTLIIPVRLEADHQYRLGFNSQSFKNFTNVQGSPAVPYLLQFHTAAKAGAGQKPATAPVDPQVTNRESIGILRQAIDDDYSYRDLRHVDWAEQFRKYGPEMEHAPSASEFAKAVAKLLEPAGDLHLSVHLGDDVLYPYSGGVPPSNFDSRVVRRDVHGWAEHGKIIATGEIPDGPTYILIRLWDANREQDLKAAYEQIKQANPRRGLVLDVRPNGGGDEPMAQRFAGCFVDTQRVYGKNEIRSGGKFHGPFDRVLKPNADGPRYRGKIAVLMGPRCVSSNESFLLMMRTVPGCKLIGATSRGASGNPKPVELPNGVTVYLSSWRDLLPDGKCFEGVGIAPDIEVRDAAAGASEHDPVLAAAVKYLKGN